MKNLHNALLLKHLYQLKNLGYKYTSIVPYQEKEPDFSLPNSYEALKKQAMECHLCELSKSRQKVVFGEGNTNADLMIIGDAPSNSDDSTGKIFTGRTGDTLTKMLENVLGLKRSDVYITNILKCRALDSSTPSSVNAHTCQPYILKEIELVKPKLIITFGELACRFLTGDNTPLADIRGAVYTKDFYSVIPTYHPSYLLRNPSAKKDVFDDLLKVKDLL